MNAAPRTPARSLRWFVCVLALTIVGWSRATPHNQNTAWFHEAQYGAFMHFLPGDARGLELVKAFDVGFVARQIESMGARYFVLTLGQNSGYFNSPNATYDRITGYAPGERCSVRDLPLDLYRELQARGIRLMLYLPCQVPNRDARAQKAFGLAQGPQDQPLSEGFARKWAEVMGEWAGRYGDKVAGWWFDGGYQHIQFNEAIATIYAAAVKRGNPNAIVTFNPGVRVIRYTQAEDYTAGELNEPFDVVPAARWLDGSQWHALTYLGSNWGQRDTRHPAARWARWVSSVVAAGGVVTLDMGPNWDPAAGPIGAFAEPQVAEVRAVRDALKAKGPSAATARLPGLRKLMDTPLRDTSICRGPDGRWYLTGTVEPFWGYNEGIRLWKSKDLSQWEPLGMVWKYGDSPWHAKYLEARKPLWAPEVHYLKGTFWLTYSLPGWDGTAKTSGCGLLKSTTGRPEGPYVDVQPSERMGDEIDASLFEDDDGTVYFLWHSGKIARMKPDLSGLAEAYHWLKTTVPDPNPKHHSGLCAGIFGANSFDHVGYEGMYLFKANGRYHLACAENFDGRYSCAVATSTHLYGPYGERYEAIPHGGHNVFYQDEGGRWWSTFFGSDPGAPWQERPGVLPIEWAPDGRIRPRQE